MSFTLCTSGAIVYKAGANVSTLGAASGAIMQQFCNEAEGFVCMATRYDWISNWASVPSWASGAVADATACIAATNLIAYDMSGYTSKGEAEDLINVLYDRAGRIIEYLKVYKKPEENK